jgi:hypothetical protein
MGDCLGLGLGLLGLGLGLPVVHQLAMASIVGRLRIMKFAFQGSLAGPIELDAASVGAGPRRKAMGWRRAARRHGYGEPGEASRRTWRAQDVACGGPTVMQSGCN